MERKSDRLGCMKLILQISSGGSPERQVPMQTGEIVRFGSSDGADYAITEDQQLSPIHFAIECHADHCVLRHLDKANPVTVNGEPISETHAIAPADLITAGQTNFIVEFQNLPPDAEDVSQQEEAELLTLSLSLMELCERVDLEKKSIEILEPEYSIADFIQALNEQSQSLDAIRLLSAWMVPKKSIFWAWKCVKELSAHELSEDEVDALNAVSTWLSESTDENRRKAKLLAEKADFATAASWVAAAVFWSGGSIADPDMPEVPVDETLLGKAVATTMLMLATKGDPLQIPNQYQSIIREGWAIISEVGQ